MPAAPIVMTFPGKVRIIDNGPVDPATGRRPAVTCRTVPDPRYAGMPPEKIHPRMRKMTVTQVTVPAGFHLEYEHQHTTRKGVGHRPEKPLALVKVVADVAPSPMAALAMHAELVHAHEESDETIVHVGTTLHVETVITESGGELQKVERIPNAISVQTRTLKSVTAKSTRHAGVTGTGPDAAAAMLDLQKNLAAHLEAKAKKPETEGGKSETEGQGDETKPAEPETKDDAKPPAPHLATSPVIPGDEGTGEGSGLV